MFAAARKAGRADAGLRVAFEREFASGGGLPDTAGNTEEAPVTNRRSETSPRTDRQRANLAGAGDEGASQLTGRDIPDAHRPIIKPQQQLLTIRGEAGRRHAGIGHTALGTGLGIPETNAAIGTAGHHPPPSHVGGQARDRSDMRRKGEVGWPRDGPQPQPAKRFVARHDPGRLATHGDQPRDILQRAEFGPGGDVPNNHALIASREQGVSLTGEGEGFARLFEQDGSRPHARGPRAGEVNEGDIVVREAHSQQGALRMPEWFLAAGRCGLAGQLVCNPHALGRGGQRKDERVVVDLGGEARSVRTKGQIADCGADRTVDDLTLGGIGRVDEHDPSFWLPEGQSLALRAERRLARNGWPFGHDPPVCEIEQNRRGPARHDTAVSRRGHHQGNAFRLVPALRAQSGLRTPDANRMVGSERDDGLAIGRDGDSRDRAAMPPRQIAEQPHESSRDRPRVGPAE